MSCFGLAEQAGRAVTGGVEIEFPLRRQDVAQLTGTTLHSASRVLRRWRRRTWSPAIDSTLSCAIRRHSRELLKASAISAHAASDAQSKVRIVPELGQ